MFILLGILINLIIAVINKSVSYMFFSTIITIIISIYKKRIEKQNKFKISKIITLSYIVSIIVMLIIYYGHIEVHGVPYIIGGSDDLNFENWAFDIVDRGVYTYNQIKKIPEYKFNNSKGYIVYLSYIIRISNLFGGFTTLNARIINIFILISSNLIFYKIIDKILDTSDKKKNLIFLLSSLMPSILYISVHNFRDPLINLLIMGLIYLYIKIFHDKKILVLAPIIVFNYLLYTLRSQFLIISILLMILIYFFKRKEKIKLKNLLFFTLATVILLSLFRDEITKFMDIYDFSEREDIGFSSLIYNIKIFPINYIARFLYSLINPLPFVSLHGVFNAKGYIMTTFQFIERLILSINFVLIIYLLMSFINKKNLLPLLIYLVILTPIIVITFTFRHFLYVMPWFYALSIPNITKKNKTLIPIMGVIYIVLTIVYNVIL